MLEIDVIDQITQIIYSVRITAFFMTSLMIIFKLVLAQHESFVDAIELFADLTAMTLPSAVILTAIFINVFYMRLARNACFDVDHVFKGIEISLAFLWRSAWTFASIVF